MSFEVEGFRGASLRRAHQRGAISSTLILVLVFVAFVVLAMGWWFYSRSGQFAMTPSATDAHSGSAGAPNASPDSTSTAAGEVGVDQLYKQARQAMSDNRMVAPPGNNALEYYLDILARQPDDSGATDAVRELFPFATGNVEDQINQGNFPEATRVMNLLAKADPSNYSLTILRGKLDAKKKQDDREQQLAAQQAQKDAAHAQAAATTAVAPTTPQTPAQPLPSTPLPGASTAASQTASPSSAAPGIATSANVASATPAPATTATVSPAVPSATSAASASNRDVKALVPPQPVYPTQAARNHQEGWVEIEFTVTAEGNVQGARVVASNPAHVFDREALAAVQRAKYEARLDNGKAVAATLRRRIEFKLN